MDRARPGKMGKYKPFVILSIILQAVGVIMLFSVPGLDNKFLVSVWVIAFYLVYDVGTSFIQPELIYRSMTQDETQRGKLMIGPRMMTMAAGMVMSGTIAIVAAVNVKINNLHTSFSITISAMMIACAVIALSGILCIKEKYIAEPDPEDEGVKITEFIQVIKNNKALRVRISSTVFSGFIYTCLFATCNYYVKWAYCANLTTGEIDTAAYGTFTLITSMMMFSPLILGTIIAVPMVKAIGSPIKMQRIDLMIQGIGFAVLVALQFTGILQKSPIPLFVCMAVIMIFMGADYVPAGMVTMEVMDYERYLNGKDRAAMVNSFGKLLEKAQSAFATAAVGVVLSAVGYIVDSVTGNYLGDLTKIPNLLNWFVVIMAVVPCICAFVAFFNLRKYPIDTELRKKIAETLRRKNVIE